MTPVAQHTWIPELLTDVNGHKDQSYSVVILNRPITINPDVMRSLWQNAKYRVTVDGGTDKWLNFLKKNDNGDIKVPDLISGDFDSISDNAIKFFKNDKTKFVRTPDQNETDFTKALKLIEPIARKQKINSIVAIQESSGRFDHIMGNINSLYKAEKFLGDIRLYLISSESLTWLLNPGQHSIRISSQLVKDQRWCALIPIGERAIVTSTGLKWDLDNRILEFGELVSTSNTYASEELTIKTNKNLIWSMGIF